MIFDDILSIFPKKTRLPHISLKTTVLASKTFKANAIHRRSTNGASHEGKERIDFSKSIGQILFSSLLFPLLSPPSSLRSDSPQQF